MWILSFISQYFLKEICHTTIVDNSPSFIRCGKNHSALKNEKIVFQKQGSVFSHEAETASLIGQMPGHGLHRQRHDPYSFFRRDHLGAYLGFYFLADVWFQQR